MSDTTYPFGTPKRVIAEKAAAEKKAKEAAAPKTEFEKYKYTLPTAPVKVAEPIDEYDAWLLAQSLHNEVLEDLGRLIMGGRGGDKSMVAQAAVKTGWPFELVNPDANQLVAVKPDVETAPTQQYPREWKTYNELHARYAVLLKTLEDIASPTCVTPRIYALAAQNRVKGMP